MTFLLQVLSFSLAPFSVLPLGFYILLNLSPRSKAGISQSLRLCLLSFCVLKQGGWAAPFIPEVLLELLPLAICLPIL